MNKRRSVSVILIILSIILIGIVGYFTLIKNPTPPMTTNKISPTSTPIKETLPTTTPPTLEKVRTYDLKFDFYYIGIEDLRFGLSKDGKYGYIASQNIKDNKYYIQVNNQTYGPYDYVSDYSFQFSNDGSKYVWVSGKDCEYEEWNSNYKKYYKKCKKYYIQINNKTYGPYDKVYNFKFSNDISKYGWIFEKDNKYYIQINNQTYGPYDLSNFTFTNDNKAYIVYIKDKKMVIEQID
jgi:hypothetical protein